MPLTDFTTSLLSFVAAHLTVIVTGVVPGDNLLPYILKVTTDWTSDSPTTTVVDDEDDHRESQTPPPPRPSPEETNSADGEGDMPPLVSTSLPYPSSTSTAQTLHLFIGSRFFNLPTQDVEYFWTLLNERITRLAVRNLKITIVSRSYILPILSCIERDRANGGGNGNGNGGFFPNLEIIDIELLEPSSTPPSSSAPSAPSETAIAESTSVFPGLLSSGGVEFYFQHKVRENRVKVLVNAMTREGVPIHVLGYSDFFGGDSCFGYKDLLRSVKEVCEDQQQQSVGGTTCIEYPSGSGGGEVRREFHSFSGN
ncbi:hypothetical protein K435DRAFT_775422 [Dendrothele bispora CBS 962.96]|uniref:Uncharacterized protein n=1 Tax=Dendrothele bispora (strain CBS 962.96) TaxID=1314807 RepID=A0A4S8MIS0_DENBC|nr:hypothetical protein K435DRAFT_775422 [Dendrothele bispora CBS 962.96]